MMALMKLVLGLGWSFLVPRWNMCQGFPAAKRLAFHLLLPSSTSITMLVKSSLFYCNMCHCKTLCISATILTCINYTYTTVRFAHWCLPFQARKLIYTHHTQCSMTMFHLKTLCKSAIVYIPALMCAISNIITFMVQRTYTSVRFAQWCVPFQARPPPDSDLQHLLTFARLLAKVGHDSFFLP